MTKVSIITAVYNRAGVISDAMQSVAGQSYPDIEHIIQDGGSTDGTLDVIARHATSAMSLESRPDEGIYDAINKGIMRAHGEIIGLMHSDDIFAHPSVVTKIVEAFKNPSVQGVYGDLDYVSASNTNKIIRRWRSGPYAINQLRQGWMPPHPTLYLRKDVFERLGLYDTSYRIAADYDAMLRYLSRGKIELYYLPEVLVKMRVGGESNKSLSKIIQKSREDYCAIRANGVGGVATLVLKNISKIKQFY